MKKELTKKQKLTLAKKEKIYEVAISLFKEYGYENTSIRDICKNANVTTGSLYNFYENKADILNDFKEKLIEQTHLSLKEDNINIDNPLETIIYYVTSLLSIFNDLGSEMTLNLHNHTRNGWKDKLDSTLLLEHFISLCQKNNTMIDDLSPQDTAGAINTIIYGLIYHWCDQNGNYNILEKAKQLLPLLLSTFIKKSI